MPLIETKGAASAQGFGEFATSSEKLYIESCFSTYLYTGNGSTQTITNGIDLSGKGGLVWTKLRDSIFGYGLSDTARGINKRLSSNLPDSQYAFSHVSAFNATGFTLGNNGAGNSSGDTYVSWTFRKAEKFFDVATWTGNGSNRTISHNLGSVPGCIIVKRTDTAADWQVYHRSLANTEYLVLNSTAAKATGTTRWNSTTPTSTEFSLGTDTTVNASGGTYVAYLFASDAGGFGDDGSESIIKCGSYTGNGSTDGPTVTLGFEPQWVLVKCVTNFAGSWWLADNMRGMPVNGTSEFNTQVLNPNSSSSESQLGGINPIPNGFKIQGANGGSSQINGSGNTYIYIAIRRPMKTPESGTEVFAVDTGTGTGSLPQYISNFPVDMAIITSIDAAESNYNSARLTGAAFLKTESTDAISATNANFSLDFNNGWFEAGGTNRVSWMFKRATGFFDVVAYTSTGSAQAVNHNLGVAPELIIQKRRDNVAAWLIYHDAIGNTKYLQFTTAAEATSAAAWNNTSPTSTQFTVGTGASVSGGTHIAYLFATLAGVSKVGSYTGTGTTKQIDCGFTAGARFVLIKRTDSTGGWYVWDSSRGISAGNDPYLLLNSTAAEVTNTDYIDTYSAGFEISSTAPAEINASGGTFIFLAVA